MRQNTRPTNAVTLREPAYCKKHTAKKDLLWLLRLLRNVLLAGFLTGIAALLCKTLLFPDILTGAPSGLLPVKDSPEPVVTAVTPSDAGSSLPETARGESIQEISGETDRENTDIPVSEASDRYLSVVNTSNGSWLEVSGTRIYESEASGTEIYKTDTSGTIVSETVLSDAASQSATSGVVRQSGHRLQVPDEEEVERILGELAAHDDGIAEIYARRSEYPKELLAALALNQEMTDFVKGFLTADGTATGGISDEEKVQTYPLFIQWDRRWGYVPYGSGTISITGCGPTCLSMVIFSLTRDESATPDALAALSMEKGYYMKGSGTTWQFMTDAASWYGLSARELRLDEAVIRQYLDQGLPIICAMRPGDFTATGHFIVIYGYDKNGYLVNDPNSQERSGRYWSFDTLKGQIRNLWGYSRA